MLHVVDRDAVGRMTVALPISDRHEGRAVAPFLRIPPFPGAKIHHLVPTHPEADLKGRTDDLARHLRKFRVGGAYWADQPTIPGQTIIVRSAHALKWAQRISQNRPIVLWSTEAVRAEQARVIRIEGECDPWHMFASAAALITKPDDEVRLVAALLGVPVYLVEQDELVQDTAKAAELVTRHLCSFFENPFTGRAMSADEAIALCGFWRRMIDANREIVGGVGFAFWKQERVAPLLWNGTDKFQFMKRVDARSGGAVAIWRSKAAPEALADLERAGTKLIEVEDGFLRSRGLGADCIPPLSITADPLGAYFDPLRPSGLERLLQHGSFDDQLLCRAGELRQLIVAAGIGKYEQGGSPPLERPAGERVHILVPGQVEDDRAVLSGGCGLTSNLELLKRVRAEAPDAYILYKPHPDVIAGHRRGEVSNAAVLGVADEIIGDQSINSLIAMVDEVHVNTSLAGFEALLRGKKVTTYGVPFYAGWGLTTDLGPVPSRRSTTRSLNELVAATLLVYPRYLDPVTGLPCPAEVVVARLAAGDDSDPGLLVGVRRIQGKFMRRLRSLVQ